MLDVGNMPRNRPNRTSPGADGTDGPGNPARGKQGFEARTTIMTGLQRTARRGDRSTTRASWCPRGRRCPSRDPDARELFDRACEQQLYRHLKAVCLWPARDRDKTWRLGDFSSYSLEFSPPGRASVSVQFWSEPDERSSSGAVTFEVASDRVGRRGRRRLDAARQEMLRDHGFERASRRNGTTVSGHFRKEVLLASGRSIRALVRETIAILCKVLDYDGSTPLEFHLHLGTRLNAGYTFDGICAQDLLKLMHRWGLPRRDRGARGPGAADQEHRAGAAVPGGVRRRAPGRRRANTA